MIESPRHTDLSYARMMMKLFPFGSAFPRNEKDSLFALLRGLAQELYRLDGRLNTLVKESEPADTVELISEHETDLGFPNSCFDIPPLLVDRQAQVFNKETFPLCIATGYAGLAEITAGSDIIHIPGSTAGLMVKDALLIPTGFKGGKYQVLEFLGGGHFRMEQTAEKDASSVPVTGCFMRTEFSERFIRGVATWLGNTVLGITYIYDSAEIGLFQKELLAPCDVTYSSNIITNVPSTINVDIGDYITVGKGLGLAPIKVLGKTSDTIILDEFTVATGTYTTFVRVYKYRPMMMRDAIGMMNHFTVIIGVADSYGESATLRCVLNKLKPANVRLVFDYPS